MNKSKLYLSIGPLGNLSVEWMLNSKQLIDLSEFSFSLPMYKYVLSEILKVPVPLSYKAIEIENKIIKCEFVDENNNFLKKLKYTIEEDFLQNKSLKIDIEDQLNEYELSNKEFFLKIQHVVKGIVNGDGIFFKIVFPVVNSNVNELNFELLIDAHFSYGIRKFKFYTMCFNAISGEPSIHTPIFDVNKTGDLIKIISKEIKLKQNDEIDFHLQATRLPFLIKKDYFWICIFILVIFLAILPILNFVLNLFATRK